LPCPLTIVAKFGVTFIFILSLSCTFGKNCFVTVAFVYSFHSFCHFYFVSSSVSLLSVPVFNTLYLGCWPLVPEFAGSNPAEAVGFLRAKIILSTPSFGGELKPSVPCRRFAACKRSLELRGSRIVDEN
jgi:hypothetical protein